jgi:nucleoside-diphosphate-sugar epimerase
VKRLLVTGRHRFIGATLASMLAHEAAMRDWRLVDTSEGLDLRDPRGVVAAGRGLQRLLRLRAFDPVDPHAARGAPRRRHRDRAEAGTHAEGGAPPHARDSSKIQAAMGWKATTLLDESLAAMLRYWESEGKR